MNPLRDLPGLQMESVAATPHAPNFRPSTWPPPSDFPVVINVHNEVVSRYGDASWDLAPWVGPACAINFEDGADSSVKINPYNASIFRQVTAWWLYGPDAVQSARTLRINHVNLKPLFVVCSEAGIAVTDLWRFPRVIEQVAARLSPSGASRALSQLNKLWLARESLGFTLLDDAGLKLLASLLSDQDGAEQSAYIPPRIWTYQVLRLRECLDEYLAHREQVGKCYQFCLDAYAHNAGSLANAHVKKGVRLNPFNTSNDGGGARSGRKYYGQFRNTAKRFGIDGLLDRWVNFSDANGVRALSNYLSLVNRVGLAYVLNFSLMRADEGAQLRADCHSVERDELGYDIHLLGGVTTKTIEDPDARWIVSPSATVAIETMAHVARLRMEAARCHPRLRLTQVEIDNPLLLSWPLEPWGRSTSGTRRQDVRGYGRLIEDFPKLFDLNQLRITSADHALANQMTFGLDPDRFAIGQAWPFTWHQLRRTGAVNMLSTGLVSEASLQYQLKHATRAMSRYYGQNWYKLKGRLDDEARGFYLREMYQAVAREFAGLQADTLVSPYGERRKAQILQPILEKDHKALVRDGEAGRISYRPNIFGGCAKPGEPCPFGGISNLTSCLGCGEEKPCEHVLCGADVVTRERVSKLQRAMTIQLVEAECGSMRHESLCSALESVERYFHVVDAV